MSFQNIVSKSEGGENTSKVGKLSLTSHRTFPKERKLLDFLESIN